MPDDDDDTEPTWADYDAQEATDECENEHEEWEDMDDAADGGGMFSLGFLNPARKRFF